MCLISAASCRHPGVQALVALLEDIFCDPTPGDEVVFGTGPTPSV